METVLVFARATGRTLVMPPAEKFYLLNKPAVEFADMFPVEAFADYMDVISTQVRGEEGRDSGGRRHQQDKQKTIWKVCCRLDAI